MKIVHGIRSGLFLRTLVFLLICLFFIPKKAWSEVVWSVELRVTNYKGTTIPSDSDEVENYSTTLIFGFANGADDGIDVFESERPPLPPQNIFDARFQIAGSNGSFLDYRHSDLTEAIWNLSIQSGTYIDSESNIQSAFPITLDWSGSIFLRERYIYLMA